MQKIILSRKCLRFFKRTFRGGQFNKTQFKEDYKALFSHVYKELYKFGNVEYSSQQVLKDVNEARKLFKVLEPYIKAVFDHYGIPYPQELMNGGMDKAEAEKFLHKLIKENKYKEKLTLKSRPDRVVVTRNEVEDVQSSLEQSTKAVKKSPKDADKKDKKQDETEKAKEGALIFYDRKSFEMVYAVAEYKYGQTNDNNRNKVCKYIADFTLRKNTYLEDAVGEALSDEHASGGKKKYSVLDKSVWLQLTLDYYVYVHIYHMYDELYYPDLYAKHKKEGGIINYFLKFFGLKDRTEEKSVEYSYKTNAKDTVVKKDANLSDDLETALKTSISQNKKGELSRVKTEKELQQVKELEPIVPNKKK